MYKAEHGATLSLPVMQSVLVLLHLYQVMANLNFWLAFMVLVSCS